MLNFLIKNLPIKGVEQALATAFPRNLPHSAGRIFEKVGFEYQRNLHSFKILNESDYMSQVAKNQFDIVQTEQPNWVLYNQVPKPLPCWERMRETIGMNFPNELFFEVRQQNKLIGFLIGDPLEGRIAELGVLPPYQQTTALLELLQHFYNISTHKLLRIVQLDIQEQYIINGLQKLGFTKYAETEELKLTFN